MFLNNVAADGGGAVYWEHPRILNISCSQGTDPRVRPFDAGAASTAYSYLPCAGWEGNAVLEGG